MPHRLFMDHPLRDLEKVAIQAKAASATKLLLLAGEHPAWRIADRLVPQESFPALHFAQTQSLAEVLLNEQEKRSLEENGEVTGAVELDGLSCELVIFFGEGSHNIVVTLDTKT